ncbi:hypothetical protein Y032_0136g1991 [Ancylostoma ceylanicum]|uniref:Uncharacterized protein n=1 Tax=Ancylostoma ceylanicum TaxID=53326 RepID=A0A016T4I3_9BILA|nr:hypothetical protein Y032_0136g1991 [Ancylostoma ceylanicum]
MSGVVLILLTHSWTTIRIRFFFPGTAFLQEKFIAILEKLLHFYVPSIRTDESAQAINAATLASSPRHHIYSAYHVSSLSF